ncbi:MAG: hypothetical protein MK116_13775 [Phycisphaerales bacterium]|nr:hypothetical protein [Phycisphaerales bacterium]
MRSPVYLSRVSTLLLAAVAGSTIASAADAPEFLAILESDRPRFVNLGSIDGMGADLLDLEEGWVNYPTGECHAVIRRGKWSYRPSRMRVILHDGQTLPGVFVEGDEEHLKIDHLWLRELVIPLDRINRIEFRSGASIPEGTGDRVVLANGDFLEGFLEQVGDPTVIETGDGERVEIPLDRVAAVAIEGEPVEPRWPQVWTIDGVRMSVDKAEFMSSGRIGLARHEFMTDDYDRLPGSDEIVALVFDGSRFSPLATMPVETINTSVARRTAPPPRHERRSAPVGLTDLHLQGPARFEFTLPDRADRFRTSLRRSRQGGRWPSPTITISAGEQELWTGTAQQDSPLDLSLANLSGPLVIELTCGDQGPVHCGVTLVDPIISRAAVETP